jgi:hypothetical protein
MPNRQTLQTSRAINNDPRLLAAKNGDVHPSQIIAHNPVVSHIAVNNHTAVVVKRTMYQSQNFITLHQVSTGFRTADVTIST